MEVGNQDLQKKQSGTRVPKKSRGHRCYFCGVKFPDIKALKKHITIHRERPHVCEFCEKSFTDKSTLRKHRLIHTGERYSLCEFCGKSYRNKCDLDRHVVRLHNVPPPKCVICDPDRITVLRQNKGKHARNYICVMCFAKKRRLGKDNKFKCSLCQKRFKYLQNLDEHISQHDSRKNPSYDNNFKSDANAINEPIICGVCQETFPTSAELSTHYQTHSDALPFHCKKCNAKFKKAMELRRHLASHALSNFYKCHWCNKGFRRAYYLKQHQLQHTEDRPFTCEICEQAFKSASMLKKHQVQHQDERPFECGTCGNAFKALWSLKQHQLIHTADRAFPCFICDKVFKSRESRYRHVRVHTGDLPFKCIICSKRYNTSKALSSHMVTHIEDQLPFEEQPCPICHVVFKTLTRYHKHMLAHTKQSESIRPKEQDEEEVALTSDEPAQS